MDTWNRLTDVRGDWGESDWMKDDERISQRIYVHNTQTQTTVWWWSEGAGVKERNGDICNSVNNKN